MTVRDAGYDDWLDAVADGEAYFLACADGHGWLPPRRVCPACGGALDREPLAEPGTVETYTVVHVTTPQLADDTPYVTAIAGFGPVRLTGFLRGVEPGALETGLAVSPGVEETETTGGRALVLRPA